MNLAGKTVLITGASSGIGKSFAYLFASKGSHVILVARSLAKMEEIAEDIRNTHKVEAYSYQKDLSANSASQELYDQLKTDGREVDILVNNAGFGKWGRFEDFSMEDYRSMIQLNVNALMDLCYLFLEDFKKKAEAGIINVGSTASFIPVPYSSVYAATKHFVLSFTEGLVGELEGTNIKVFCLCPGGTESNFATVANSNNYQQNASPEMKSSDEVAQIGLDAFQSSKHYVITGRKGQLNMMKLFSRKRVIDMIANYWKERLGL
ncbi:MAG: SDR family oxidoreductase [Bacteroidota bacterium]